jgi:hypothetical protein
MALNKRTRSGGVAAFVKDLADLDHGERLRRISLAAREQSPEQLAAMVDSLRAFGDYGAHISLVLAKHAKRSDLAEAFLTHESAFVRSHSVAALFTSGATDEQLVTAYAGSARIDQERIVSIARRERRISLAAKLAESGVASPTDEVRLLPLRPAQQVEDLLAGVEHLVTNWSALARAHPEVILRHFFAQLASTPLTLHGARLLQWKSSYTALSDTRPEQLVELFLHSANPDLAILGSCLPRLMRRAPDAVSRLLTSSTNLNGVLNRKAVRKELRNLRPLDASTGLPSALVALAQRFGPDQHSLALLLSAVKPSLRSLLLAVAFGDRSIDQFLLHDDVLEVLPAVERSLHVQRMLQLPEVVSDPLRTVALSSFLPFDALPTQVTELTARSDANDRATGYRAIILSARRARRPEAITLMLIRLQKLRNDQDPVRSQALSALAEIHPSQFTNDHGPALLALAVAVIEARDTSYYSTSALTKIMNGIIAQHAYDASGALFEAALESLSKIAQRSGSLYFPSLVGVLPPAKVAQFLAALLPFAKQRAAKDREQLVISIAAALGRLGWDHPELQAVLRETAVKGSSTSIAESAIRLYLGNPVTRATRVRELVSADESVLLLRPVADVVNWHMQSLLTPMLDRRRLRGRFSSSRQVQTVQLLGGAFDRWNPDQHRMYRDVLASTLSNKGNTAYDAINAVQSAAALPSLGMPFLQDVLVRSHDDIRLFEAALGSLAKTDRPDAALSELLTHAGSDRARVALYGAGYAARRCRPGHSVPLLERVALDPGAKITSRKEAIRLLAVHQSAIADRALVGLVSNSATLHKDLRIALCWAGLRRSDSVWAQPAVDQLAVGSIDERQALLKLMPLHIAPAQRASIARHLVRFTEDEELSIRLGAFHALLGWIGDADSIEPCAYRSLTDFKDPAWRAAGALWVSLWRVGRANLTRDLVSTLVARLEAPGLDLDVPSLERLEFLALQIRMQQWPELVMRSSDVQEIVSLLSQRPEVLHLAGQLSAAVEDWTKAITPNMAFTNTPLLANAYGAALANSLDRRIREVGSLGWTSAAVFSSVQTMLADERGNVRLVAVHLLRVGATRMGWPEPWKAILVAARRDADTDVVRLAFDIRVQGRSVGQGEHEGFVVGDDSESLN